MNLELFRKYNVPGPRYTSYPTVPYWETSPTEAQWIGALKEAIQISSTQGLGAAMYIHIPFCESLCTYCGCNTRISRNHAVSNPYIDTVIKEFNLYREKIGIAGKLKLSELHLGGGTPTFLTPAELTKLLSGILEHCETTPDFEYSVEVDPRVTSMDHLNVLREFRFERISLGIQDFDPKVQDIVNRTQTFEQVKKITDAIHDKPWQ